MTPIQQSELDQFQWYHEIKFPSGATTKPAQRFVQAWELIDLGMTGLSLKGKRILDVGCRDGKYSMVAEAAGASVVAIDNNASEGFAWLRERLASKIDFREINLYELEEAAEYDVVFFFGVLYHLRFPMNGLNVLGRSLKMGGKLLIESGMMDRYQDLPMMYCPVRSSPYEITSCTFFNLAGLTETLWSLGFTVSGQFNHGAESGKMVRRWWIEATKTHEIPDDLKAYWSALHHSHA